MDFIDTHVHIYLDQFKNDLDAVVQNAKQNGVGILLMPNLDRHSIRDVKEVAATYPGVCLPMMGIHPCYVKEDIELQLEDIKAELDSGSYFGIGEIGLDLHWDKTFYPQQEEAFITQVKWAMEKDLPVSIHTREATPQAIALLKPLVSSKLKGVFHCFVGSEEEAKEITEMGFHLGIGGVSTYKNSTLEKVLPTVSLDKLILETDAPYLPPVPFRGKRNESAYIPYIAKKVAEIYQLPLEQVAQTTTQTAKKLFNL